MLRAEVRDWYSQSGDLETWSPEDRWNFDFDLDLAVGAVGVPGHEQFTVTVCTPRALTQQLEHSRFVVGAGHLVVDVYDIDRILSFVKDAIGKCWGETWFELVHKVSRYAVWEYETLVDRGPPRP